MNAVLMHKNIGVATIEYEDGRITDVREILNGVHMPVGTYQPTMSNDLCTVYLQAWQRTRAIPGDRSNLQLVMDASGKDVFQLGVLSHGMGLTDQYWVRDKRKNTIWEEINFYRNGFQTSSLTLIGKGDAAESPDYETNGSLPKSWILLDKVPVLLKDSPEWLPTASANEAVAYQVAQACGVQHAMYFPISLYGKTFCATPCFIGSDREEFVSLLQYMRTHRGPTDMAAMQMELNQPFLETMTAFDLLTGNTDRHEGNFGIIINPDTMEFLRPAPLFDSGNSLHQWTGATEDFKPFFQSRQNSMESLGKLPFAVPAEETLRNIVSDVYKQFGVAGYAEQAADELSRNAAQLMEHQEQIQQYEMEVDEPCL